MINMERMISTTKKIIAIMIDAMIDIQIGGMIDIMIKQEMIGIMVEMIDITKEKINIIIGLKTIDITVEKINIMIEEEKKSITIEIEGISIIMINKERIDIVEKTDIRLKKKYYLKLKI